VDASPLFSGTSVRSSTNGDANLLVRIGGKGPPLLLLHGFPQTHAMWHRIAPALMERFTCVMPDLRGYGGSTCLDVESGIQAFSKRAMADDMSGLMAALGHRRFAVVGHDRGGRVAYRMALDHPEAVSCLAVLDIVPTWTMWHGFSVALAMKAYHWLFLAQPYPLPEMLIGQAPVKWLDYTIASWTKARDLSAFDPAALFAYREAFLRPEAIHAQCNDYRAGATIDLAHDEADRAAGRRIGCAVLALWGDAGFPAATDGPLSAWREWASDVSGHGIDAGHFIAEENPAATRAALLPFLDRHGRAA
jgi:haloacetate dehalogenase